jgi:large subunit ribosomal protein L22
MPHYKYGYQGSDDEVIAKAQLYNIDASYKDMAAVCDNIRGMDSEVALQWLEKAASGDVAVEYRKWNKKLGHRRELGGKKGRYPKKAAKYVLQVLKNAIANGVAKGLGAMRIVHASATKQAIYPRLQSKGRQMRSDYITGRVEVVLKSIAQVEQTVPKRTETTKIEKSSEKSEKESKVAAKTEK